MKRLCTLIILISVVSFAFTSNVQASTPSLPQGEGFLCGDVNEDGLVNVLDIISMVNYIMGGNPSPFNTNAANINAEGGINVLDIIALVNIIMQVPGMPCGCVAPVLYEGQSYATVQIGDQCWFRENLNVGIMVSDHSTGVPHTHCSDNDTIEKYCYNQDTEKCAEYGGLYDWNEMMQYGNVPGSQGICPVGWHIPSDAEWCELLTYLDPSVDCNAGNVTGVDAGGKMKEPGLTHWASPNTGATNQSGFSALGTGCRAAEGGSAEILTRTYFWTSNGNSPEFSSDWFLENQSGGVGDNQDYKTGGLSVRCLQGCWPEPSQSNAGSDQLNIVGTSTTLAGNTPIYGTGVWHIISGTGGVVAETTSPTSTFTGAVGNTYSLTWTITTQCGSSTDEVVISFVDWQPCPGIPTVEYEGQTYNTVLIGDQCWFKENLNVGSKINSTQGGSQQTDNGTIEKYCYYNDEAYCDVYGGLYEWPEAMQYTVAEGAQGICPQGWHVPSDSEWTVLADYLGGPSLAGGKMKSTGTILEGTGLWLSPNTNATNESRFTGLPGGNRHNGNGEFYSMSTTTYIWSSTEIYTTNAWDRYLGNTYGDLQRHNWNKMDGFSVRCLKDCWPEPTQSDAGPDQLNVLGTTTYLEGNVPVYGTGIWSIISGTGGIITDPSDPTSTFLGLSENTYTLRWTISNECSSNYDEVTIRFVTNVITWDDGAFYGRVGMSGAGTWYSAARFTTSDLALFDGMFLTKVRFVPADIEGICTFTLKVWIGANAANEIVSQEVTGLIQQEYNIVVLSTPVEIDATQELWIGLEMVQSTSGYPAGRDQYTNYDGKGNLLSYDAIEWIPISVYGITGDWNIQGYIEY